MVVIYFEPQFVSRHLKFWLTWISFRFDRFQCTKHPLIPLPWWWWWPQSYILAKTEREKEKRESEKEKGNGHIATWRWNNKKGGMSRINRPFPISLSLCLCLSLSVYAISLTLLIASVRLYASMYSHFRVQATSSKPRPFRALFLCSAFLSVSETKSVIIISDDWFWTNTSDRESNLLTNRAYIHWPVILHSLSNPECLIASEHGLAFNLNVMISVNALL